MKFFLAVIAMVLIIEGFPYFAFPARMKEVLNTMSKVEPNVLRFMGLTLIIIGLMLLYFFR